MENKIIYIGIVLALNSILNECKLGDLKKEDKMKVLENKFKFTKVADDFEKKFSVVDNFKTNRYKELEAIEKRSKAEETEFKSIQKKIEAEINGLRMEEASKEVELELETIEDSVVLELISANDLNISQSELLYKYMK